LNLILIDEPIEKDHRVLNSIKKYENTLIVDCAEFNFSVTIFNLLFNNFRFILIAIFLAPFIWLKLYSKYNICPKGFFTGFKKSLMTHANAKFIAKEVLINLKGMPIETIHTNDLFCGLVGLKLTHGLNAKLVYDAHELEFHRNRKNSFTRVAFDMLLEKSVIKAAAEIIVVNKPIKTVYMDLYHIDNSKISIVNNNHFTPYIGYAKQIFSPQIKESVIVYVGGSSRGRKLESLADDSYQLGVNVYCFFLGNVPRFAEQNNWIIGSKDYLDELLELVKHKHLAMWCCTDDICLSYRLSLPNKFFQAMSIGIPVIAYEGSYLADIVNEHKLGYIYDGNNFSEIVESLKNVEKYLLVLNAIETFQEKLFVERMSL
jgi:glycosyltransferase involved in cell wall biosynthesis